MNQLAVVLDLSKENAVNLFEEGGLMPHLETIRANETSVVYDMSKSKDVASCRSAAAKIAKLKTAIDKLGKDHNEGHRDAIASVNEVRNEAKDYMQETQDLVRKPLTDHENAETARKERIQSRVAVFKSFGDSMTTDLIDYTIEELKERSEQLAMIPVDESFEEFTEEANTAKAESLDKIEMLVFKLEKAARELAEETERLAEAERMRQIEETARIKAEAKIQAEKDAQEAVDAEKAKTEQAASDKIEADTRHERELKEQEQKRLDDIATAKQKWKDDLADSERRIANDRAEEERQAEKKAANTKHRKTINNSVLAKLNSLGIDDKTGQELIKAIVKGEVEYLQINY